MLDCSNCPRLAAIRDRHNALVRAKQLGDATAAQALEAFRADMSAGRALAKPGIVLTYHARKHPSKLAWSTVSRSEARAMIATCTLRRASFRPSPHAYVFVDASGADRLIVTACGDR